MTNHEDALDLLELAREEFGDEALRQQECSAIQHQFNLMAADMSEGHGAWRSEYQNDPPEPDEKAVVMLKPEEVIARANGLERNTAPAGTVTVVESWDAHRYCTGGHGGARGAQRGADSEATRPACAVGCSKACGVERLSARGHRLRVPVTSSSYAYTTCALAGHELRCGCRRSGLAAPGVVSLRTTT